MDEPLKATVPKPCCVCDAQNGKHCAKCKSRHYCSKKCQLVDWRERGHKAQCRQMAADFQDRLLDELMPAKLKIKEEPAIVGDVLLADGSKAAARFIGCSDANDVGGRRRGRRAGSWFQGGVELNGCSDGKGGRGWRGER